MEYDLSHINKLPRDAKMQQQGNDPLSMIRNMWGNLGFGVPGVAVPTFDADELEKRIADLKAVEGWLSMNLSMLQITIRNLEMQVTTLRAVKAMGEMASQAAQTGSESFSAVAESLKAAGLGATEAAQPATAEAPDHAAPGAGLWPWALMQQVQEYVQRQAEAASAMTDAVSGAVTGDVAGKPASTGRRKRKAD